MWVDLDLDSTLPHQQKLNILNKQAYLYVTILCTLLSFSRYGFLLLFCLIIYLIFLNLKSHRNLVRNLSGQSFCDWFQFVSCADWASIDLLCLDTWCLCSGWNWECEWLIGGFSSSRKKLEFEFILVSALASHKICTLWDRFQGEKKQVGLGGYFSPAIYCSPGPWDPDEV